MVTVYYEKCFYLFPGPVVGSKNALWQKKYDEILEERTINLMGRIHMNDRIRWNMLWNSVGSIVYMGGQWVLSVLVVRTLGYTDAGIFSLAMSLTNTFYSLANYGIRNFQVSDLEELKEMLN